MVIIKQEKKFNIAKGQEEFSDLESIQAEIAQLKERAERDASQLINEIKERWNLDHSLPEVFDIDLHKPNLNELFDKAHSSDLENEEVKKQVLKVIEEINLKLEQYENIVEATLIASEPLPDYIENLSPEEKKNLNTKSIKIEKDNPLVKDLSDQTKTTLIKVYSVLNKGHFPGGLIGSLSQALLMEINKIPKDLDNGFDIPDFNIHFPLFKQMEQKGDIEGLQVVKLTGLDGKPDGSFEVRFFVKGDPKEISIFYSNINPDKPDNGIVSVGYKENTLHFFELPDGEGGVVEIYTVGEQSLINLYAFNFLVELSVLSREGRKEAEDKYPWVTPKALHRMNNLMQLCGGDFSKIVTNINNLIKLQTETKNIKILKKGLSDLVFLKRAYKNESGVNRKETQLEKPAGLVNKFAQENNIIVSESEKIIKLFTENMKEDMNMVDVIEENAQNVIKTAESLSKEEKSIRVNELEYLRQEVIVKQLKYQEYLENVDYKNTDDFILFTGSRMLVDKYFGPVIANINVLKLSLLKDIKE